MFAEKLIFIVERVHFDVLVAVQKAWQKIFSPSFVLRYCNSFRQRYKTTNIVWNHSEILYWESKLDKVGV